MLTAEKPTKAPIPEAIVPNVSLPDGCNLVPTAYWTGDGWLTQWAVRTAEGFIEPLHEYAPDIEEDGTLIPWPFIGDYAIPDDFRAIGWQVIT